MNKMLARTPRVPYRFNTFCMFVINKRAMSKARLRIDTRPSEGCTFAASPLRRAFTTSPIVKNNGKQRSKTEDRLLGGCTGRGFMPGESGNPMGRPPSKGLVNALREAVSQVDKTGRSVEQLLADVLIFEAIKGKHRLAAINSIYDRLEGKPRTSIEVKSQSDLDISNRSSEEVECALALGCWPEDLKAMGHDPA